MLEYVNQKIQNYNLIEKKYIIFNQINELNSNIQKYENKIQKLNNDLFKIKNDNNQFIQQLNIEKQKVYSFI